MTKTLPARAARRLPELSQIAQLLAEVAPEAAAAPPPAARPAPPARAAGASVANFFGRVNWRNDPVFGPAPDPVVEPGEPVAVGALAVGAFFAQVNWRNDPAKVGPAAPAGNPYLQPEAPGRTRPGADRTVESVLTQFAWD